MSILNEVANIIAPRQNLIARVTVSTTAARFAIPAAFAGRVCTWELIGTSIYADFAFGNSSVVVTLDTHSTVAAEAITVNAQTGKRIVAGEPKDYIVPIIDTTYTHFSVDSSGDGFLEIHVSGQ